MAAQLALDQRWTDRPRPQTRTPRKPTLCAACQAREARYGFRPDQNDPLAERPRTLCFECFRAEIGRRREAAHTIQVRLPLEQTLDSLRLRRRRAQIAARHALAAGAEAPALQVVQVHRL
jgi:hypothetical protein